MATNVERLGGNFPFGFPATMSVKELSAGDLFMLIRRAVAEGNASSTSIQRVRPAGGSLADAVRSNFDQNKELISG